MSTGTSAPAQYTGAAGRILGGFGMGVVGVVGAVLLL